jgi:hypothetical protein
MKTNPSFKYAVALHDVTVSGGNDTVKKISFVRKSLGVPVTVHLVCDKPLSRDSALGKFLRQNIKNRSIEVVFHGIHHLCEKKVWRALSWYHKYQAEYLVDSRSLREESSKKYAALSRIAGYAPGICPPCWLAIGKNTEFLKSLSPSFFEMLLHVESGPKRKFSTVISIGSAKGIEVFFLKILGRVLRALSFAMKKTPVRVAVHVCDLDLVSTMDFFKGVVSSFNRRGYHAVRMRDLV